MPLFMMGFLVIVGVGSVVVMKLWADTVQLRSEMDRMRETQDALIEMVSSKLLEDDALSREFLQLKTGKPRRSEE